MALTEEQRLQVEANMGLIGKVLKDKLRGSSALGIYTHEDLFQIGCVGLCKAVAEDKSPLSETSFDSSSIHHLKKPSLFRCRTRSFLPARQIHGWKPGAFLRFARNRVSSALLSRTRIIRWKLLTRSRTSSRSKRLCLKLNSIWLNKKQRRPFLRNLGLRCCLLNVRP